MLKPSIIKLCGEIQALSIFITNITEHDVFVDYAAHVNKFEIKICIGGWNRDDKSNEYEIQIRLVSDYAEEELITLKKELQKMLNEIYKIDSNVLVNRG